MVDIITSNSEYHFYITNKIRYYFFNDHKLNIETLMVIPKYREIK